MTPRERMITALQNKQPDRIPVTPDISNMVPCKLTGKPFWEVYVNQNPPLWRAYLDAVRYFGIDGWFIYGEIDFKLKSQLAYKRKIIRGKELYKVATTIQTPDGELSELQVCPADNPPTAVEKLVKDFRKDYKKFRHLYSEIVSYDTTLFERQKKELGQLGILEVGVSSPGLHNYIDYFDGNMEAVTFAYYDYPDLFQELRELHEKQILKKVEIAIEAGTDSIRTGGSGSITLQSPKIWCEMSLPTIKKVARMCKEAGVISGIHSCGKERYLIETCANETDINYINPLELPPMGDCDLLECKEKYGHKIALMGNLHTVETMLFGSEDDVRRESLKAILSAGRNGGFVLSTGDQCGRDTPEKNIFAMVQAAKQYGKYPLDIAGIEMELQKIKPTEE